MKTAHLVLIVVAVLILLQLAGIGLYLLLDDDTETYSRELILSVEFEDEGNGTVEEYMLILPLPVWEKNGSAVIGDVGEFEVMLGRCNMTLTDELGFYGLRLVSDSELLIRYTYEVGSEDLEREDQRTYLSSLSGDIRGETASISIYSNTSGLSVKEHLYQEFVSPGGRHAGEFLLCSADLIEGESRYPLRLIERDERFIL